MNFLLFRNGLNCWIQVNIFAAHGFQAFSTQGLETLQKVKTNCLKAPQAEAPQP
jgi:hypothetical protein